ncbi:hypothetical protein BUALT_Bualt06G0092200 [Buddleja alternifolia]|uniref:Diacylglycerol O-acyltransferase n=1 Tax=Buddleja alternifolia TaxID=168488 RepID=A0AAV6XKL1_9LAMI|nr:hypothetical protein BUALT_Bualt06G0092200 [Buddleja alternifolia]
MSSEEEPASPTARVMQSRGFNFCIVTIMGFTTPIDVDVFKKGIEQTMAKHPRFFCALVAKDKTSGDMSWKRTDVDIDNHVFAPDLDPNMENPDKFVEDFASDFLASPMDMTKPLWEVYILNVKTVYANSTAIFKIHHSLGDGLSLISLFMACAKKTSNPESVHVKPLRKQKPISNHGFMKRIFLFLWTMVLIGFNTLIGCALFVASLLFFKDSETPIKGSRGIEISPKRFVHKAINLDDVKLVKNALNVSMNDVLLGATEAALSRYLNRRYEKLREKGTEIMNKTNFLPRNLRFRSAIMFSLKPHMTAEELIEVLEKRKDLNGKWGNLFGFVIIPFTIALEDDPLVRIYRAKANMDKKKYSLEAKFPFKFVTLLLKLFGLEVAGEAMRRAFDSCTVSFSNVTGPREAYSFFGHDICYLVPSLHGAAQSLFIHCQSYGNKLVFMLAADEKKVPDPHELCDDFVTSFESIKEAVINRGLVKHSKLS